MPTFMRHESKASKKTPNEAHSKQVSIIGPNTTIRGTIESESDLNISGRLVGSALVQGKLVIPDSGVVEGDVKVSGVDVAGKIQGEITASGKVLLKSTANILGNIQTERLVVEEGARFNGECSMGKQAVDAEKIMKDLGKTIVKDAETVMKKAAPPKTQKTVVKQATVFGTTG